MTLNLIAPILGKGGGYIQQKNGDLVVLNAYKRNGMKRKESWVHENEIECNNIERVTLVWLN